MFQTCSIALATTGLLIVGVAIVLNQLELHSPDEHEVQREGSELSLVRPRILPCSCGEEVANITDSDLYLRYILGEIDGRHLMTAPERHLRCNPTQAQFIVDDGFPPIVVDGVFDKRCQDDASVREREVRVTQGWRRLQEVRKLGIPISEYPLEDVREGRKNN